MTEFVTCYLLAWPIYHLLSCVGKDDSFISIVLPSPALHYRLIYILSEKYYSLIFLSKFKENQVTNASMHINGSLKNTYKSNYQFCCFKLAERLRTYLHKFQCPTNEKKNHKMFRRQPWSNSKLKKILE